MIEKLPLEIDALSLLSEALNFDFAPKGMDEPFTDEMSGKSMQGMQAIRDGVLRAGKANPTRARLHHLLGPRPGARPHGRRPEGGRRPAGAMFTERACDGFVLSATHVPGAYEDFVARGAGAAAPRPVPQGLCGHDAARELGPEAPGRRL